MQAIFRLRANGKKVSFLSKSFVAFIFCITSHSVFSQSITVTATADVVDGNTANIAALTGTPGADGLISLREAVLATNGEPAGATINITLPAATITLSIPGTGETATAPNASIGDLDVLAPATGTKTVNILGAGSASSVISQTTGTDRIFDVHPNNTPGGGNITFSISGARLTGGVASAPVSGGALLAGRPNDAIVIADCLFNLNTASSNGGAISQSSAAATHNLTITNTTFSNNTASTATGGAINYAGRGAVSITGCTFSNNSAGTQGGAMNVTGTAPGPGTVNILRNTFTGNVANGATFGGASVAVVNAAAININFNRIIGNTAAGVASGKNITTGGGAVGSMNTNNNWWGVNTGPAGSDILGTAASNWLQLKTSATPGIICTTPTGPGNTSTVKASFQFNSANAAIATADLSALVGLPVTWTATLGTLGAPQELTIQADGEAINTFTSNGTGGTATVRAQVDNIPVTDVLSAASITVNTSSTAPTGATGTTSICSGGSTTLTVAGGSKGTGAVTEWFTGSCGGTAIATGDVITVSPTSTTTYYVRYSGVCDTTSCDSVIVTVKTPSTAPTGATGNTTICSGANTTLTVDGGSKGTGAVTQWFTGSCGGTSAGTGDAITVSPTTTTTYYVRYSGDCNTTDCAQVTVTVKTLSVIPTGATGITTICAGNSTTLTVDGGTKGTGAITEWFTGSCGGIAAGTGDAITVSPTVTTKYYVRYSGDCNTTSCDSVIVTVNTLSSAPTGATGNTTICAGSSTTLTVDGGTKGTGAITEWFTGSCGGTAAGTGDAITVSPSVTTTYYVRYNGICNITTCATVTVTVKTASIIPTGATGITTICAGGSTTLTVDGGSKGTGAITEWFTGSCGGTAAGTGDTITVSPTVTTKYYMRYSGDCNTTSCDSVVVTVNTLSTAPTGATGNTSICNGSSTTLTVAGGFKGTGAVTEWFTGSCGSTLIGTGDAITVSPSSTTTYYVRYSGICNTTTCAAVTVTVSSLSIAPTGATGNTTVCSGGSTTLTVTGGFKGSGAVTQWFTGSCGGTLVGTGDAITVSPASTTTYYVRYSGGCNTTSCATVTVTVFNAVVATCSTNNTSMYFGYAGDQSATIKATVTGGTAPYTVSITMNRPLNCNVITSSGDELWSGVGGTSVNNVCPASGPGLTPVSTGTVAGSGGFYSVNVTLMQDATFTATITDANGCTATCTVTVHAEDARCFAGNSGNAKVKICHKNGNGCDEICVNPNAVDDHLAHGDFLGDCTANCEAPLYTRGPVVKEEPVKPKVDVDLFEAKVIPNPTEDQFTLVVQSGSKEKIVVLVYDATGRVVKQIEQTDGSGQMRFGADLKVGTYMAVVRQGNNIKTLKLLKL